MISEGIPEETAMFRYSLCAKGGYRPCGVEKVKGEGLPYSIPIPKEEELVGEFKENSCGG